MTRFSLRNNENEVEKTVLIGAKTGKTEEEYFSKKIIDKKEGVYFLIWRVCI